MNNPFPQFRGIEPEKGIGYFPEEEIKKMLAASLSAKFEPPSNSSDPRRSAPFPFVPQSAQSSEQEKLLVPDRLLSKDDIDRRLKDVSFVNAELEKEKLVIKQLLLQKIPQLAEDSMLADLLSTAAAVITCFYRDEFDRFVSAYHAGDVDSLDPEYISYLCSVFGDRSIEFPKSKEITLLLEYPNVRDSLVFYPQYHTFGCIEHPIFCFTVVQDFFSDSVPRYSSQEKIYYPIKVECRWAEQYKDSILAGERLNLTDRLGRTSAICCEDVTSADYSLSLKDRLKLIFSLEKYPYEEAAVCASLVQLISSLSSSIRAYFEDKKIILKPVLLPCRILPLALAGNITKIPDDVEILILEKVEDFSGNKILYDFDFANRKILLKKPYNLSHILAYVRIKPDFSPIKQFVQKNFPPSFSLEEASPIFVTFIFKGNKELKSIGDIKQLLTDYIIGLPINSTIVPIQLFKVLSQLDEDLSDYEILVELEKNGQKNQFELTEKQKMKEWINEPCYAFYFKEVVFV